MLPSYVCSPQQLGNVFHGPPPTDPDSDPDTPPPNQYEQHQAQYPYGAHPYGAQPQFGPGGGYPGFMPMGGGMPDPTSTWALQAQIQAQQAQMLAMQMAMQAQMAGGDPNMHYQSMVSLIQSLSCTV